MDLPVRYAEFAPAPDLASHVACTWESISRATKSPDPQQIVPDGCADIIVFGNAPPHLARPTATSVMVLPPPAGTLITAIRFRPGAVRAVLGCDADKLEPSNPELLAICGRAAQPLLASLRRTESTAERRRALEAWTRARLSAARKSDQLVLLASARIARMPWLKIDDVATEFGVSGRQLRREFIGACGFGPKTLQRVMRFQRVLRLASAPIRLGGLADLAAAAGYADQAHMAREFQDLIGAPPSRYLPEHDPELGRWLDS